MKKKVLVLGSGNFGTSLAYHLASLPTTPFKQGDTSAKTLYPKIEVALWARDTKVCEHINKKRRNPKYLTDIDLPDNLTAVSDFADLKHSPDTVIIAVPTQSMRQVLEVVQPILGPDTNLICASKGIETSSLNLPMEIVKQVLGKDLADRSVIMSGPSFASEIVKKFPTCVAAAGLHDKYTKETQNLFHSPLFRVYTSDDPIGLEIAGALKNVIALASGATIGLGFQNNSQAALITRGLYEITQFGVKMGAKAITFNGLGGVGDLFLTCTSSQSRNFTVGYKLGQGMSLKDTLSSMTSVAEGVYTSKAAFNLGKKLNIQTPIIDEVHSVLYENKPIKQALYDLITRKAHDEFEFL